jgi:hypothetical protein
MSVRTSLSAIGLVVALVGSTSTSAFMLAVHPVCTAEHHDCGKGPTIRPCCCGDQHSLSDQTGPTAAKVTFNGTLRPVTTVAADVLVPDSPLAFARATASPPRSSPVDLPTLFASLLI